MNRRIIPLIKLKRFKGCALAQACVEFANSVDVDRTIIKHLVLGRALGIENV